MKLDDPDKQLSAALGRLPSGVFIITARRGDVETGMLASWVQQCSFKPPMISMALQPGRPILTLLEPGAFVTLNVLESSQTDMLAHFGRGFALEEDAFHEVEVEREGAGGPVLTEALAALECQIVEKYAAGDHEIFIAQVISGKLLDEGQPMVHIRKNAFHY